MRPALPGAVLVLGACVCLLLATISTPVLKSLSFLDATAQGQNQSIRLGCLGYCVGSTCTSPSIGWSFDPNELLGVSDLVPAGWGRVAIKGLTYTLVLHPVALGAAVLTFVLGLFTACRGSTGCCTSIIAGLAAGIAVVAFGLDLALFLIAKKRIEAIGGQAQLGAAIWLTLAAWVLLIVSTCLTSCNSCCGGGGGRNSREKVKDSYGTPAPGAGGFSGDAYGERMRLEALEAERRRKGPGEAELPKFAVYETEHVEHLPAEESRPLRQDYDQGYGGGGRGGYGQQNAGYADPYAQQHSYGNMAPYGEQTYSNSPAMGYAAGVGPGQRRGTGPDVQSVNSGYAGYGAHAPNRANSTTPRHQQEPTYTPGVGPQPYRDGLDSNGGHHAGGLAGAAALGAAAGAGAGYAAHRQNSHDPYADQQQQYGEQQQQYGEPHQYANAGGYHAAEATFGVPQRSGSTVSYNDPASQSAYGQSAYGHEQSSAYAHDMPSQAQAQPTEAFYAGAPPRRLPSVPAGERRQATNATTDDGFGLAVLQAGAAAAQRHADEGVSPHDDAHRSAVEAAYGQHHAAAHQQQAAAQQYAQPHDAYEAQGYAHGGESYAEQQQGYAGSSAAQHKSLPPPGYEAHEPSSSGYPREKR